MPKTFLQMDINKGFNKGHEQFRYTEYKTERRKKR